MPLELVTGPANSAKARLVLDAYLDAVGREPILVVPRRLDVEHYRRELAGRGVVFGVRVERFAGLIAEISRRAGGSVGPVSVAVRERIAARAVTRVSLRTLAESARGPGFAAAMVRLVAELEGQRIDPPRFGRALRAWGADDPRRIAYGADLVALYDAYRALLQRLGRPDRELHAHGTLDAISVAPERWRGAPVFFYGFDDFTAIELDTIETLAGVVGAAVTVSLPFEAGRAAFAGRAGVFGRLRERADEHVAQPARSVHYEDASRGALHHLERWLFDPSAERIAAGNAIRLLAAGGERAELEAVAGEIAGLMGAGVAPQDIAVVTRSSWTGHALAEQVFAAHGIPLARRTSTPFEQTSLGRGLLALLRCALLEGSSADLLVWLRTPGVVDRLALTDRLERSVRREGTRSADGTRELWERDRWALEAIDRLRSAQADGPPALLGQLERELEGLFAAPRRRRAATLTGPELPDARALAAGRQFLRELGGLSVRDPGLVGSPRELATALAGLAVVVEEDPTGGVLVTDPLALRARRVRALFVCGLQEGGYPAPEVSDPFLSDEERADLARASGLVLHRGAAGLDAERFLFYATVSRAQELLVLSWHTSDDDGVPGLPSLFVADVRDLFDADLSVERPGPARTEVAPAETMRETPIAALSSAAALAELTGRPAWSASSLEQWAGCPVRWFVERFLDPQELEPESEALRRGSVAHAVLESTFSRLGREAGSPMLTPGRLPQARRLLGEALDQQASHLPISTDPVRLRVARRRLEADLSRYLEQAASSDTVFEPRHLELDFGMEAEGHPALELGSGVKGGELGALRLRGRIDRVDVDREGRRAIVYDYKGRRAVSGRRWETEGLLQVPLYMLAVRRLLGLAPVGGFYQPLAGPDPRPRGALRADADPDLACFAGDRFSEEDLEAMIDGAVKRARGAVAEARTGALVPRPRTCSPAGGCSYPVLCRCEGL